MRRFDEKQMVAQARNNLNNKEEIIALANHLHREGYSNIFFVGVGGTYSYAMIMDANLRAYSTLPFYAEHAADFCSIGNRRFNKDSLMIVASSTGDTPEVLSAMKTAHEIGARIIAFVETPFTPIANAATYFIAGASLYRFYTFLFRLAYLKGEYMQFDEMMENITKLPEILPQVSISADAACEAYAIKHRDDELQYLIGAGNLWGSTYLYAMCIMEEMQWMRTKSITAGDFFHGTLEVIERDSNIVMFFGEDKARSQMKRVENFIQTICANVTKFDTKDFDLPGIDEQYRGLFSPIVLGAITPRISVHLEEYGKHPMEIRRYYRQLKY